MKKIILACVLVLAGCVSPDQVADQRTQALCSHIGGKTCYQDNYQAMYRDALQEAQAKSIQRQAALQSLGQESDAYNQQKTENAVFAANPDYGACRYYGQCNQTQPTHTTCRNVAGTLQCDTY